MTNIAFKNGGRNWKNWSDIGYLIDDSPIIFNKNVEMYNSLFTLYDIETKNMTLLDIGSGHGNHTLIFEKLFKKIYAIDPEEHLIETFNKKIKELNLEKKIKTEISDCENFESKKKFDMITFCSSFLFFSNKKKCLDKSINLLKKNGYILLVEPRKFTILNKKVSAEKNLMIETLNTFFTNKKIKLIHFFDNMYLFQANTVNK
jgi:ubiquinone/menaquinone biosynthesis C-methylase UbiE